MNNIQIIFLSVIIFILQLLLVDFLSLRSCVSSSSCETLFIHIEGFVINEKESKNLALMSKVLVESLFKRNENEMEINMTNTK